MAFCLKSQVSLIKFTKKPSRSILLPPASLINNITRTNSTIDASDLKHLSKFAAQWWNPEGPLKPSHAYNVIRVPFIRDSLVTLTSDTPQSTCLRGKKILEVGCGPGILSETVLVELTVPWETNIPKDHALKQNKYYDFLNDLTKNSYVVDLYAVEVLTYVTKGPHKPTPVSKVPKPAQVSLSATRWTRHPHSESMGLAKLGADLTAIDPSKELIQVAVEHSKFNTNLATKPTYIQTTVEEHIKYHSNEYDAIVSYDVIEHINNAQREFFVESCIKALKPGGTIIITTPNRTRMAQILGIFLLEGLNILPRGTHQYSKFTTPDELKYWMEINDCRVDLVKGYAYYFWSHQFKWIKWQGLMYAMRAVKLDKSA